VEAPLKAEDEVEGKGHDTSAKGVLDLVDGGSRRLVAGMWLVRSLRMMAVRGGRGVAKSDAEPTAGAWNLGRRVADDVSFLQGCCLNHDWYAGF
jgi:hypothetical protein